MNDLPRIKFQLSNMSTFDQVFESQWNLYALMYPNNFEHLLYEILKNYCITLLKQRSVGDHFLDMSHPDFKISVSVFIESNPR